MRRSPALRILGCEGGVRSVPGIVDSVVERRPNTGVRLGRLINQKSHAIRVPELSTAPPKRCNSNDAISTFEIRVGELRATFLRNYNMRRHKDPSRRQPKHRRPPQPRQPPQARGHCTRYGALHPLRGGAPVTWRYTRTEEVHCLRIGCSAPTTRTNAELAHRTTHRRTPPCAAGPYWRQDGHAAHAATCTPAHSNTSHTLKCEEPVNLRIQGPKHPPIGPNTPPIPRAMPPSTHARTRPTPATNARHALAAHTRTQSGAGLVTCVRTTLATGPTTEPPPETWQR